VVPSENKRQGVTLECGSWDNHPAPHRRARNAPPFGLPARPGCPTDRAASARASAWYRQLGRYALDRLSYDDCWPRRTRLANGPLRSSSTTPCVCSPRARATMPTPCGPKCIDNQDGLVLRIRDGLALSARGCAHATGAGGKRGDYIVFVDRDREAGKTRFGMWCHGHDHGHVYDHDLLRLLRYCGPTSRLAYRCTLR